MARAKPAPVSVWRPMAMTYFLTGAPHYPEHVDESYWQRDAERRAMAGANIVRMGEFAWHPWPPNEGHFSFDLFDRAIDVRACAGVKTVLCTPTATLPRWLTAHYPEVLRVDAHGRAAGHGSRQHAATTSPVFRSHARRITRAMADHYRDNPQVVGWQTDNELNTIASESCSPLARLAFQTWLHLHYSDIATLNHAWDGAFRALAYDTFEQIDLPRPIAPSFPSPGHVQDCHRFLARRDREFPDPRTSLRFWQPAGVFDDDTRTRRNPPDRRHRPRRRAVPPLSRREPVLRRNALARRPVPRHPCPHGPFRSWPCAGSAALRAG